MAGGDRFATGGKDALDKRSHRAGQNVLGRFIAKPPPAQTYGGLHIGPGASIEYESNAAVAVDGSSQMARSLSPFMIQVEPPMAFAAGGFMDGKQGLVDVTSYRKATKDSSPFFESRRLISASNFATADYGAVSQEEFVSKSTGGQQLAPPGAVQSHTTSASGRGDGAAMGIPSMTDLNTAIDIGQQLKTILETPPLVLLINPESLSIQRQKVQQYSDRTRQGYVFHAWGQEQEKLSITARCGAFISGGRGVQYASKRDSASWQNLMALFQFYRNNGYIYDTIGGSNAHHFVGALSIHYDQWIYFGNMDTFSWTHDISSELGGVIFSMEFVANTILDTADQVLNVMPMRSPSAPPQGVQRGQSISQTLWDQVPGRSSGVSGLVTPTIQNYVNTQIPVVAPAPTSVQADATVLGVGGFTEPTGTTFTFTEAEAAEASNQINTTFTVANGGRLPPPEPFKVG